jgi:hypothetical protein
MNHEMAATVFEPISAIELPRDGRGTTPARQAFDIHRAAGRKPVGIKEEDHG